MNSYIYNNNNILLTLLLLEENEDQIIGPTSLTKNRKPIQEIFKHRKNVGFYAMIFIQFQFYSMQRIEFFRTSHKKFKFRLRMQKKPKWKPLC
jgi:hypothetical protein